MKLFYTRLFSIILISLLGIIVYSNTLHCSFHLDDDPSIFNNDTIKNIHDLQSIWNFWPCRFITYLTIAFNYHLNGLDLVGYHLFNITVHLISAILVWWLVLLTLSTPAMKGKVQGEGISKYADLIALFTGLIFVSHPIQTQGVTYIIQRAASMAAMFYLASLCLYTKARLSVIASEAKQSFKKIAASPSAPRNDTNILYICSLLLAIAAMFTKEMSITLPLMIMLYEFIFLTNKKDFNWASVIPFLLTLSIIPLTMLLTHSVSFYDMRRSIEDPSGISPAHYLITQLRVIVTYIRLFFLPINQNVDYDYSLSKSIFELPVLLSLLSLIMVLGGAKRLFPKYRIITFSILWFFLTLLPESSIVPIKDLIFEHRLYLPLVGYSILLVAGAYYLWKNNITLMIIVLTMLIVCNSVLTYQRNKVWIDELTLWSDAVSKSPHKARPYGNRGNAYYRQGDFTHALLDYKKAFELDPHYEGIYNNLGVININQGNLSQALFDFNRAIEEKPKNADAYINRGVIYYNQGQLIKAISDYTRAIELNPKNAEVYNNRGVAYDKQGDLSDAIFDYSKAIELKPEYADAYDNRAASYFKLKEYAKAWDDVQKERELGGAADPAFITALKQAMSQ